MFHYLFPRLNLIITDIGINQSQLNSRPFVKHRRIQYNNTFVLIEQVISMIPLYNPLSVSQFIDLVKFNS